jgi:presenilin-like A22 family membrane protease
MFSLSVKKLNLLNIAISLILIVASIIINKSTESSIFNGLDIIGGIMFIFSILVAFTKKESNQNIARYILIVTFLTAIFASFVTYFSSLTDNQNMFALGNIASAVWLLLLFYTKTPTIK